MDVCISPCAGRYGRGADSGSKEGDGSEGIAENEDAAVLRAMEMAARRGGMPRGGVVVRVRGAGGRVEPVRYM